MNIKDFVFWILIIGIIGLGIYTVKYIHSESYKCMNNPYTYSINLLEKANGAPVICTCTAPHGTAILTRDGFKPFYAPQSSEEEYPNLTIPFTKE